MGGLIFSEQEGKRVDTIELNVVKDKVTRMLSKEFGLQFDYPRYIREKATHGDLDVVVAVQSVSEQSLEIQAHLVNGGFKNVQNGNVISYLLDGFQVDLILVASSVQAKFAVDYFSYGDLGNLLGYYARHLGLRLGYDGLYSEENVPNEGIKKTYITKSWPEALRLLGLDPKVHSLGFDKVDDMFDFVKSSELFEKEIFSVDKLNSAQRRRLKKRADHARFIEIVKA
ncbi:conserved hypothetical protein [Vibrio chagasii]|nr:conserved hypothetical protein [Vibrio chagasii]